MVLAVHALSGRDPALASLERRLAALEQILLRQRWLPVSTVADRLGVSSQAVRGWIHAGRCPARQWRGRYEIDPAWLAAELAHRSQSFGPDTVAEHPKAVAP